MYVRSLPLVVALVALTAAPGCVTFSARPLAPTWTASSHIQQQEQSGLSVAARSLGGAVEEDRVVGRPAKETGLFPVVLLFENQGDSAFLLRREGVRMETADGKTFTAARLPEIYERLRYSHGISALGVPLGIFPAFMISSRVSGQNRELLDDLRGKTIHDVRLYNNPKSYNCLVFFEMEPEQAQQLSAADCWLSVEVERQATAEQPGEVLEFRLVPEDPSL